MNNEPFDPPYEYCPRCYANLTLQKGYRNDLPYWICLGCGEMLINPEVDADDNIAWICDGCGKMLTIQPGFREDCGVWKCTECGCENKIDPSELYLSEDEYQAAKRDPYRGLSDEEALRLLHYHNEGTIDDREDIISVRHVFTGKPYLEKQLTVYNREIYEYLKDHPVSHMPRIIDLIYDGLLDDMEDYLYDGVLKDDDEAGVPYGDWYDTRSDEYGRWYDCRSDVYSEWYDTRSDVYGFKYDLAGELWSKDEDGAQKTINRFEKKLNKRVGS